MTNSKLIKENPLHSGQLACGIHCQDVAEAKDLARFNKELAGSRTRITSVTITNAKKRHFGRDIKPDAAGLKLIYSYMC